MYMKRAVILFSVCLAAAGCSEPGESTKLGAATGGVVGAGLGAIVGSTSGNAGTGLVIGAAAGAGTGALIGNALDGQEQRMHTQDEALERQRQLISAQRGEIEELRKGTRDTSVSGMPSTAGSSAAAGLQERSLDQALTDTDAPRGTGRVGSAASKSLEEELAKARQAEERASLRVATPKLAKASHKSFEPHMSVSVKSKTARLSPPLKVSAPKHSAAALIEPEPAVQKPAGVAERDLQASAEDAVRPASEDATIADSVSPAAWGDTGPERQDAAAEGAAAIAPQQGAVGSGMSDDCRKAQKEVSDGDGAPDTSDKLFHLRRALRLCPDNASYHNKLGEVYRSLNRTADAQFEFREALNIDPGFQAARNNLGGTR